MHLRPRLFPSLFLLGALRLAGGEPVTHDLVIYGGNAAGVAAAVQAARSLALLLAAAQRFDRAVNGLPGALAVLTARGARLDAAYWSARQARDATARGEAVADLLVQLSGLFPPARGSG